MNELRSTLKWAAVASVGALALTAIEIATSKTDQKVSAPVSSTQSAPSAPRP